MFCLYLLSLEIFFGSILLCETTQLALFTPCTHFNISVWNGRITTYYHIVRKRKRTQKEGCKARTGKFRATHKSHPKIADSAEKMRKVAKNIPNVSGESHNETKAFLKSHSYHFLGHSEFISKRCDKMFWKKTAWKFKSLKMSSNVAFLALLGPIVEIQKAKRKEERRGLQFC